MAATDSSYRPPLALTIISSISIGVAAVVALWILLDIVYRRGWKSMMLIMIPVYVVNALYLWPITLWTYINYGRPPKATNGEAVTPHCAHYPPHGNIGSQSNEPHSTDTGENNKYSSSANEAPQCDSEDSHLDHAVRSDGQDGASDDKPSKGSQDLEGGHRHHNGGRDKRPMFATITVAVCHCGAGCVIGDIIGEWIVYGADVTIRGRMLWPEFMVDFLWAIALGVFFQYFSIAPMAGEYGAKTLYRALKADFLSLLFFEIGLFGWMAIFQIAIFQWRLEMNTVTYWWMMQIGMFCGHWTGVPINWWLIKAHVKEPCA